MVAFLPLALLAVLRVNVASAVFVAALNLSAPFAGTWRGDSVQYTITSIAANPDYYTIDDGAHVSEAVIDRDDGSLVSHSATGTLRLTLRGDDHMDGTLSARDGSVLRKIDLTRERPIVSASAPCGYVDFRPFAPRDVDAFGRVREHIQVVVRYPDKTEKTARLDYPFEYASRSADPFVPGNDQVLALFQFPAPELRAGEPPAVQYVLRHTFPDGYTMLRDCSRR